jgi:voltage-gated sodium channel
MPMITFLSSMRAFRIFRMFRALRALRMMKRLEKLRVIVQALLSALPSVGWVVVLLLIIYYVYAVIGTNLFSTIAPDTFGTLWESLYTLFQITLADDLGEISRPLLASSGISAVIYFVSFVILSAILVLNVIVGVVVDSVSEIKNATAKKEQQKEDRREDVEKALGIKHKNKEQASDLLQEIHNLEQQLERVKSLIAVEEKK